MNVTHYLFGNILGLSDGDLWIIYLISFIVLPPLVAFQRPLLLMFEPSVAASQGCSLGCLIICSWDLLVLSMISSLQAVGVVLALGMLIGPAATIYLCSDSFAAMFWGGGILGMIGSCAGFARFLLAQSSVRRMHCPCPRRHLFLAYLFSPKYGVLSKFLRRRHLHEESLARWEERSALNPPPPNASEEE